jgi:hypothetical protein
VDGGDCVFDGSLIEGVLEDAGAGFLVDNIVEHLVAVDCENPTTEQKYRELLDASLEGK